MWDTANQKYVLSSQEALPAVITTLEPTGVQLTNTDAKFRISLSLNQPESMFVEVTITQELTATNTSVSDLADDIREAIESIPELQGKLEVTEVSGCISISTVAKGPLASLRIRTDDTDQAYSVFRLPNIKVSGIGTNLSICCLKGRRKLFVGSFPDL